MNSRTFFIVHGAISFIYALGFLVIPRAISGLYGATAGPVALLAFRYFGVALLGVGLVFWFARDINDRQARRAILDGVGIADLIGVLVSLWGTTSGTMNALGWTVVLLYAALFAGCYYFRSDPQRMLSLKFR